MSYMVVGRMASRVTLEVVTRYPAPGLSAGAAAVIHSHRHTIESAPGMLRYCDYAFDEAHELVPGRWIFEIWHAGRKLGDQAFCVYDENAAQSPLSQCPEGIS